MQKVARDASQVCKSKIAYEALKSKLNRVLTSAYSSSSLVVAVHLGSFSLASLPLLSMPHINP